MDWIDCPTPPAEWPGLDDSWSDYPRPIKTASITAAGHVVRLEFVDGQITYCVTRFATTVFFPTAEEAAEAARQSFSV